MLANTGFTHLSHLRQVFTVHYRAFTYIQRRYVIVANVIIKISTVYRRCLRKRTEIAYCLTRYSTTFGSYCFERFLFLSRCSFKLGCHCALMRNDSERVQLGVTHSPTVAVGSSPSVATQARSAACLLCSPAAKPRRGGGPPSSPPRSSIRLLIDFTLV